VLASRVHDFAVCRLRLRSHKAKSCNRTWHRHFSGHHDDPKRRIRCPIGTAAIAVPINGRSNVVVVDTGPTRYTWSEATRRGTIVLTVNAQVEFYRDGDWFVVLDSKGGKHRFALIGATAREQKPTTEAKPAMAETFTSDGLPTRWQSLTSGGAKVVRKDGDRLYIENVQSQNFNLCVAARRRRV
jgi:hypothetical protein